MKIYAGIGSRETPDHILELFEYIGRNKGIDDWMLRSGHAKGSDLAFEIGCDFVNGKKEIFTAKDYISEEAFKLAEKYHPAWNNCNEYARKLHARNGYIILGSDLCSPVDLVICYAPGGYFRGGTSQGLRIARDFGILIKNVFDSKVYKELCDENFL